MGTDDETRSRPPVIADDATRSSPPGIVGSVAMVSFDTGATFEDEPERYAVEGRIGAGGMGAVLAAKGSRLGRPVALKIITVDREDLRQRFEREAQITARLQHPAIVPVYGAGHQHGLPFYAMKHVTGEPLDAVIAKAETPAERIALLPKVIAVTEAIAYAHAEHVIHRDLKPANILVGAFGETVVIDWGLAKDLSPDTVPVEDATPLVATTDDRTAHGKVMGTPAYMPVEQARGEPVDERADVYALGAILYHLLAGRPPYRRADEQSIPWETMVARVIAGEPAPLSDDVPPDLRAIAERAMARNARDRYPSAGELAADLRRFQTGQLVGAHRYSTWQLVRRWLKRHRTAVSVGTLAIIVIAVLSIIGIRQIIEERDVAQRERETAESERATAQAEREKARASRDRAEELLDFQVYDLSEKLEPLGKLDLLDATSKKAVDYYTKEPVGATVADQRRRATALRNLSRVLTGQQKTDQALEQAQRSLALFRVLAKEQPDDIHLAGGLVDALLGVSDLLGSQSKGAESLAASNEAVEVARAQVKARPDDPDANVNLALALDRDAQSYSTRGDTKRARELMDEQVALTARFAPKYPDDDLWQHELASSHRWLARLRERERDAAGAIAEEKQAFAIFEHLATAHPDDIPAQHKLAQAYGRLALVLARAGDHAAATEPLRGQLGVLERIIAVNPTNAQYRRDLAVAHTSLGRALYNQRQFKEALAEFRTGLGILQPILDVTPNDEQLVRSQALLHTSAGTAANELGDPATGITELRQATEMYMRLVELDRGNLNAITEAATAFLNLSAALIDTKDLEGALAARRTAAALWKRPAASALSPQNRIEIGRTHWMLGQLLLARKELPEAVVELTAGADAIQKELDADPKHRAGADIAWKAYDNLGDAQAAAGKRDDAAASYKHALELVDTALAVNKDDPDARASKDALRAKASR